MPNAHKLLKLPVFNISRKMNKVLCMPISYTFSVNSACDCNCKTCNISSRLDNHMSYEEWDKVVDSIGTAPYWITVTGGNQFLRKDFDKLIIMFIKKCKPAIVNIPVNGTMPKVIFRSIKKISKFLKGKNTILLINLSIDGVGPKHDAIRGKKGNFKSLMETFNLLKKIESDNLSLGFYTIASRYNINEIPEISRYVESLGVERYGIEPAEARNELRNTDMDFGTAATGLDQYMIKKKSDGVGKLRQNLRRNYHRIIDKSMRDGKEIIPCYAGLASVHISHDGEVWQCVTKASNMGSLRENNYDFHKILNSSKAASIRKRIKKEGCYCTHSNPSYTNQLCTPSAIIRLIP